MRSPRTIRRPTSSASLYRLIYCSRNVLVQSMPEAAADERLNQQIDAIVATARRRNTAENVTGALLSTPSGFAQVLEGPRDVLEQTFERIGSDPRHTAVTVLSFTPTAQRCFPDWPLGFAIRNVFGKPDPLAHLLADAAFSGPRSTRGSDVLRMLEEIVVREDDEVLA